MFSHFQFCENLKNALESIQRNQPNIRAKHQHTQLKGSQFATAGSLLKTTPVKLTGNSQQPQKSVSTNKKIKLTGNDFFILKKSKIGSNSWLRHNSKLEFNEQSRFSNSHEWQISCKSRYTRKKQTQKEKRDAVKVELKKRERSIGKVPASTNLARKDISGATNYALVWWIIVETAPNLKCPRCNRQGLTRDWWSEERGDWMAKCSTAEVAVGNFGDSEEESIGFVGENLRFAVRKSWKSSYRSCWWIPVQLYFLGVFSFSAYEATTRAGNCRLSYLNWYKKITNLLFI